MERSPARRQRNAYGGRLRRHSEGPSRWDVHQADSPGSLNVRETRSARSCKHPEPNSDSPRPGTEMLPVLGPFSHDHRPDPSPMTRPRPQAAAHRHAGVSSPSRRAWLRRRLRPSATLSVQAPTGETRNIHSLGTSSGPTPRSRFRPYPRRFPRRPPARSVPGYDLGLLQLPLRPGSALRAHRGDPRRHGQRPSSSSARPQGSLVGQPQNGRHLRSCQGRQRQTPSSICALASHYVFNPLFCMPARGNEKPDAESTVRAVQRRFSTPVPRVDDLDELNRYFRERCQAERQRTVQSLFGPFLIGTVRRRTSRGGTASQPSVRSLRDPPRGSGGQISDRRLRSQSVQRPSALRVPDGDGQGLRRPGRDCGRRPSDRDPHAVPEADTRWSSTRSTTLRPWAVNRGPWTMLRFTGTGSFRPASPLPRRAGRASWRAAGARRYVRVLQLLVDHPLTRVRQAVETCRREQLISAEAVIQQTRTLAAVESQTRRSPSWTIGADARCRKSTCRSLT